MVKLSRTKNGILIMALLILSMLFSFYVSANDEPVLTSHDGHETISIAINEINEISINGKETSFANLSNALNEQIHGSKDRTVVTIEGEDNTNMEQILTIENVLRDAGLFRVVYMNKLGLQLNLILPPPGAEKNLDHLDPESLLSIELMENGDVKFKGKKLNQGNMKEFIEKKLSENQFAIVRILTHTQTLFADFHHLLKQVKQAGAVRILVDTQ